MPNYLSEAMSWSDRLFTTTKRRRRRKVTAQSNQRTTPGKGRSAAAVPPSSRTPSPPSLLLLVPLLLLLLLLCANPPTVCPSSVPSSGHCPQWVNDEIQQCVQPVADFAKTLNKEQQQTKEAASSPVSVPSSELGQALQWPTKMGGQVFRELCRLIKDFEQCVNVFRQNCRRHITISLIEASYGFLCNEGFETFMASAECLMELDQRPNVKRCHDRTLKSIEAANNDGGGAVGTKLDKMCSALGYFSACVRVPIRQRCGVEAWRVIFRVLKDTTRTLMPKCEFEERNEVKEGGGTKENEEEDRDEEGEERVGTNYWKGVNEEGERSRKEDGNIEGGGGRTETANKGRGRTNGWEEAEQQQADGRRGQDETNGRGNAMARHSAKPSPTTTTTAAATDLLDEWEQWEEEGIEEGAAAGDTVGHQQQQQQRGGNGRSSSSAQLHHQIHYGSQLMGRNGATTAKGVPRRGVPLLTFEQSVISFLLCVVPSFFISFWHNFIKFQLFYY